MIKSAILLIFLWAFQSLGGPLFSANVNIFMAADNDLEEFAYNDLEEIKTIWMQLKNVAINIELHTSNESKRITFKNNEIIENTTPRLTEPKTQLANFAKWSFNAEEKNILIIWGHGQGPLIKKRFDRFRNSKFGGIFTGSKNYSPLSSEDLAEIFSKYKYEILIFDMCLMQNIHVLNDVSKFANIIIASAQIQNFNGLPYDLILKKISEIGDFAELAKHIIIDTATIMPNDTYTLSALHGNSIPYIYQQLNYINTLIQDLILESAFIEFIIKSYLEQLPHFPGDYYDIGMYIGQLNLIDQENDILTIKIQKELAKLQDELNFGLIFKKFGGHYVDGHMPYYVEYFQGLSINQSDFPVKF